MKLKIKYVILLLFAMLLSSYGQKQGQVDQRLLIGEWTRTDSPSQIKIMDVLKNGKLEVAYYDPKPINIVKAHWTKKTGTILSVYVELQDEKYFGCYYKLTYNLERDILIGEYFQADPEVSHPVEFVRTKL